MALLRATRSRVLLFLSGIIIAAVPFGPDATAVELVSDAEGIVLRRDGAFQLSDGAGAAPAIMGAWERYGILDGAPVRFAEPFDAVRVRYQADVPRG
ncbi:MAG TPA: hypothetical protein VEZ12_00800, partial [Herpetosiphonaceae bacterium]|nr:hypothetical protein [Herpetosiphonaceae bacterium]